MDGCVSEALVTVTVTKQASRAEQAARELAHKMSGYGEKLTHQTHLGVMDLCPGHISALTIGEVSSTLEQRVIQEKRTARQAGPGMEDMNTQTTPLFNPAPWATEPVAGTAAGMARFEGRTGLLPAFPAHGGNGGRF